MINRCKTEILELHRFFEDWFNSRIPEQEESLNHVKAALSDEFTMVTPSAILLKRSEVISNIRSAYGLYLREDKPSTIEIKNMRGRLMGTGICLMIYEEWQDSKGRLSSALFKNAKGTPNEVAWLHLHEVRIP